MPARQCDAARYCSAVSSDSDTLPVVLTFKYHEARLLPNRDPSEGDDVATGTPSRRQILSMLYNLSLQYLSRNAFFKLLSYIIKHIQMVVRNRGCAL